MPCSGARVGRGSVVAYLGDARDPSDDEVASGIISLGLSVVRAIFGGADLPAERERIDGIIRLIACDPQLTQPATRQEWAFLRCIAGDSTVRADMIRAGAWPNSSLFKCGGADSRTRAYANAVIRGAVQQWPALLGPNADPKLLQTRQPWGPDAELVVCGRTTTPGGNGGGGGGGYIPGGGSSGVASATLAPIALVAALGLLVASQSPRGSNARRA